MADLETKTGRPVLASLGGEPDQLFELKNLVKAQAYSWGSSCKESTAKLAESMQIGFGKLREEQCSITTRFPLRQAGLLSETKYRVTSNHGVYSILCREDSESYFKGAKGCGR